VADRSSPPNQEGQNTSSDRPEKAGLRGDLFMFPAHRCRSASPGSPSGANGSSLADSQEHFRTDRCGDLDESALGAVHRGVGAMAVAAVDGGMVNQAGLRVRCAGDDRCGPEGGSRVPTTCGPSRAFRKATNWPGWTEAFNMMLASLGRIFSGKRQGHRLVTDAGHELAHSRDVAAQPNARNCWMSFDATGVPAVPEQGDGRLWRVDVDRARSDGDYPRCVGVLVGPYPPRRGRRSSA